MKKNTVWTASGFSFLTEVRLLRRWPGGRMLTLNTKYESSSWYLHSDVEPRDVEGLEHDLGRVLSIFRCVQRRLCLKKIKKINKKINNTNTNLHLSFHTTTNNYRSNRARAPILFPGSETYQEEVMILRLSPQVLEDDLLHEALHQVPVFHDPVTDRPLFAQRFSSKATHWHKGNERWRGVIQLVSPHMEMTAFLYICI